ncbi:hypothetical protein N431DRAFT_410486, partial [Stipitochalara longipes BDJ]
MTSENLTQSASTLNMASQRLFDTASLLSISSTLSMLLGGVALMVAVVSYLAFAGSSPATSSSRKAQQARAMREAYKSMEKEASKPNSKKAKVRSFPAIMDI